MIKLEDIEIDKLILLHSHKFDECMTTSYFKHEYNLLKISFNYINDIHTINSIKKIIIEKNDKNDVFVDMETIYLSYDYIYQNEDILSKILIKFNIDCIEKSMLESKVWTNSYNKYLNLIRKEKIEKLLKC